MTTLAMILHEPEAGKIRSTWDLLEQALGWRGVRIIPFPHVTLFGCEGVEHPALQAVLARICGELGPLRIETVGLGVFTHPRPVLYLPVVRTPALSALHARLWEDVGGLGGRRFELYAPERWVPHLTLAQDDLGWEGLPRALDLVRGMALEGAFEVRNLTLLDWIGPRYEPRERYPLLG